MRFFGIIYRKLWSEIWALKRSCGLRRNRGDICSFLNCAIKRPAYELKWKKMAAAVADLRRLVDMASFATLQDKMECWLDDYSVSDAVQLNLSPLYWSNFGRNHRLKIPCSFLLVRKCTLPPRSHPNRSFVDFLCQNKKRCNYCEASLPRLQFNQRLTNQFNLPRPYSLTRPNTRIV